MIAQSPEFSEVIYFYIQDKQKCCGPSWLKLNKCTHLAVSLQETSNFPPSHVQMEALCAKGSAGQMSLQDLVIFIAEQVMGETLKMQHW